MANQCVVVRDTAGFARPATAGDTLCDGTGNPIGGVGPTGPEGPTGPQGPQGTTGTQGPQGLAGNDGATGPQGTQGIQGLQGVQGVPGADGTNGTNGAGVPVGGTTGQVLQKLSAADFNTGWTNPGGGSDPWTYLKLASDFTTTSASAVAVTGLAFTPAANTQYKFEGALLLRTATTTVGPRPGLAWATGMSDGVATIQTPSSATAFTTVNGNIAAAMLAAVGGLPTTTQSYQAFIWGTVLAGATPSGTLKLQLASETAGTTVTAKAGSYLQYRII